MELGGDEPPAVVNLITNGWAVGQEAVPATLLDLAARKVVAIERAGPDRYVVRVPPSRPTGLTSYEQQVDDHVRGLESDGIVPCEALTTGPQGESKQWWKRFRTAVSDDARSRGLSRKRWASGHLIALRGARPGPGRVRFRRPPRPAQQLLVVEGRQRRRVRVPRDRRHRLVRAHGVPQLDARRARHARRSGRRRTLARPAGPARQRRPFRRAAPRRCRPLGPAAVLRRGHGVAAGAVRGLPMGAESETDADVLWRAMARGAHRLPPLRAARLGTEPVGRHRRRRRLVGAGPVCDLWDVVTHLRGGRRPGRRLHGWSGNRRRHRRRGFRRPAARRPRLRSFHAVVRRRRHEQAFAARGPRPPAQGGGRQRQVRLAHDRCVPGGVRRASGRGAGIALHADHGVRRAPRVGRASHVDPEAGARLCLRATPR